MIIYKCRRTYLHNSAGLSRLVPPIEFMSKDQLRRLRQVEDKKKKLAKSPRVNNIRWVSTREVLEAWGSDPANREYLHHPLLVTWVVVGSVESRRSV